MSYIDIAIPGVVGLVAALWPRVMFIGSKTAPTPERLRKIRIAGFVLIGVAMLYSISKLM